MAADRDNSAGDGFLHLCRIIRNTVALKIDLERCHLTGRRRKSAAPFDLIMDQRRCHDVRHQLAFEQHQSMTKLVVVLLQCGPQRSLGIGPHVNRPSIYDDVAVLILQRNGSSGRRIGMESSRPKLPKCRTLRNRKPTRRIGIDGRGATSSGFCLCRRQILAFPQLRCRGIETAAELIEDVADLPLRPRTTRWGTTNVDGRVSAANPDTLNVVY